MHRARCDGCTGARAAPAATASPASRIRSAAWTTAIPGAPNNFAPAVDVAVTGARPRHSGNGVSCGAADLKVVWWTAMKDVAA